MSRSGDPLWDDVPAHVRAPPPPAEPDSATRRGRWPIAVAVVLVVALAGWAGWATYAMRENENRAVAWQQRASALDVHTRRADAILAARTQALNVRVDQLNTLGSELAKAQSDLKSSQGDVSTLEVRQRQLAAEKAGVEDQAQMLDGVAGAYVRCKLDLVNLLGAVAKGSKASAGYATARSSCANADAQLRAYLSAY
jgi:hypothetical protein